MDVTNEDFPMRGRLEGGPCTVGFRTEWRTDAARLYRASWEPETNPRPKRPILLAVWYPAEASADAPRMRQREYFDLPGGDETVGRFRERYLPFCRATALQEVMDNYRGPNEEPASPEQIAQDEAAFEEFLDGATAALRDAPPTAGRFPLILNHPGLGAAYMDNTVLHEYLASHGYVVVCSAYQNEGADSVNIDWDLERSVKDLDFLVNAMADAPNVLPDVLGAMGHSYGAQAVLTWRAENNSPVRAVVSHDSTVEYGPEMAGFARLRQRIERPERMTSPLMIFANDSPQRDFAMTHALIHAERFYVAASHLSHNDFLTHGGVGADFRAKLRGEPTPHPTRLAYEEVCRLTRRFFDATLKNDADAHATLQSAAQTGEPTNGVKISAYKLAE